MKNLASWSSISRLISWTFMNVSVCWLRSLHCPLQLNQPWARVPKGMRADCPYAEVEHLSASARVWAQWPSGRWQRSRTDHEQSVSWKQHLLGDEWDGIPSFNQNGFIFDWLLQLLWFIDSYKSDFNITIFQYTFNITSILLYKLLYIRADLQYNLNTILNMQ